MKKSQQVRKSQKGQRQKEMKREKRQVRMAPAAISVKQSFNRDNARVKRFPGRELIGDVNGSVAFATTRYPINPGLALTFPRLSSEAAKWEQYRFHSLKFEYINRVGSTNVGNVILTPEYNTRDRPPSSEREAGSNQDAEEGSTWEPFGTKLNPQSMFPFGPRKLIRSANVSGDMNLYDAGSLYVSTVGEADASTIGKLYVEYDVEFYIPQNSPADDTGPSSTNWYSRALAQTFASGVGSVVDWDTPANNPLLFTEASGIITPTLGCYRVFWSGSFADTAAENFNVVVSLRKNSIEVSRSHQFNDALANGTLALSTMAVVAFDGDDTLDVYVVATGAAGTLTSVAMTQQLMFVPA